MIKIQIKSFAKDTTILSKEDEAAISLKDNLQEELAMYPNAMGTIYILTSIRIFGQKRNDIDMLVMGFIDNLILKNPQTKNYGLVKDLDVKSFICNIELKSHAASSVKREGLDYIVSYSGILHNASQQCNEAKFSLYNHLNDQLNIKPFICDVLWLNGLSKNDLSYMRGSAFDNALHRGFKFRDLINVILQQANVMKIGATQFCLDCFSEGEKEYNSIVDIFTAVRKPQGLTKQKFELISQKNTEVEKLLADAGDKLMIVTGRAGTGKTVQLLQLAFMLANEDYAKRCLILTYNNALVSDIKRLIDYTPMPSKVDGRTVSIKTIHSFFLTLMKEVGVDVNHLNPQKRTFDADYNQVLKQLYDFVVATCQKEDIDALKDMAESTIDWDYILIDEAQDFSDLEKEILFKIYGVNRLIVADGVDQFMRVGNRQIWERGVEKSLVRKPKTMDLERRQKSNLVSFVNSFARLANLDWKVKPNDALPGGEIKIYSKFMKSTYDMLKANCDRNKCENYDILILEPPTQVTTDCRGNRFFSKAEVYIQKAGIPIFDGINNRNRTTYPTKDQCRVYQYDSCRGLEGWCVVCADFDELIQYKLDTYKANEDELCFDPEVAKKRSVLLWALMPLTRPIDTLVITLNNANSEIGKMLKQLADIYPDFIEWNID
ncbi:MULTISPECIES: UvrD-helicase domain-containing protein [unclassified Bacteroides]|uniref:UvrD-helicase domain-containing protein n=1 Tax=unclassified Bacteroides TaxID=2646097 RepID=UPI0004E1E982|nr:MULTISPECIES: UvrD-helicase domain-containing protein [unclassified Bacteroides]